MATDDVPHLPHQAAARADGDGLSVEVQVADAESLPFDDPVGRLESRNGAGPGSLVVPGDDLEAVTTRS